MPGETYRLDLRVPAKPPMVAAVRRALDDLRLPAEVRDDARLLASELVTNSLRHASLADDDLIAVRAELSNTRIRVTVVDGAEQPRPRSLVGAIRPLPGVEAGWGLYLVDQLATRWGRGPGNYWFELDFDRAG